MDVYVLKLDIMCPFKAKLGSKHKSENMFI